LLIACLMTVLLPPPGSADPIPIGPYAPQEPRWERIDEETIVLSWGPPGPGGVPVASYKIRIFGDDGPHAETLDADATSFTDVVGPLATRAYSIQGIGPNGEPGEPTMPIFVNPVGWPPCSFITVALLPPPPDPELHEECITPPE